MMIVIHPGPPEQLVLVATGWEIRRIDNTPSPLNVHLARCLHALGRIFDAAAPIGTGGRTLVAEHEWSHLCRIAHNLRSPGPKQAAMFVRTGTLVRFITPG